MVDVDLLHLLPLGTGELRRSDVVREVEGRYGEDWRHYHTLEHARTVAGTTLDLGIGLISERELAVTLLAAWFHDVVYDPHSATNEDESASLAAARLRALGAPQAECDRVGELIMYTKTHEMPERDLAGACLLDADLAILSAPWEAYAAYSRAIREEFAWVEEETFRTVRAGVLDSFLARGWIYRTERMKGREQAARDNLAREIERLRAS